jgi:hypothetical protein
MRNLRQVATGCLQLALDLMVSPLAALKILSDFAVSPWLVGFFHHLPPRT